MLDSKCNAIKSKRADGAPRIHFVFNTPLWCSNPAMPSHHASVNGAIFLEKKKSHNASEVASSERSPNSKT